MLYGDMRLDLQPNRHIPADRIVDRTPRFYNYHKAKSPNSAYSPYLATLHLPPEQEILFLEDSFPAATSVDFFELAVEGGDIKPISTELHTVEQVLTIEGRPIPGMHVSHHLCHAYYAYSQFGERAAAIVTFDGGAPARSFRAGGLYFADGGRVAPVHYHRFLFGGFYEGVGLRLALGPDGAPGKLMGLAAWGTPVYCERRLTASPRDAIRFLLGEDGEARYSAGAMVDNWMVQREIPLQQFDLSRCAEPPPIAADIAASTQAMFTDAVLNVVAMAEKIAETAGFDFGALVLAGGCALNCPANSAVFRARQKRVFVPPAVNDEGNSVGAAMCCASLNGDSIVSDRAALGAARVAYKGIAHPVADRMLDGPDIERLAVGNLAQFLAKQLAEGAVAGIFYGAAEIGPRALGHRSLVASPLIADNARRINVLKGRELWRPLAPVVLDRDFHRYFDGCPEDSFYMLFNALVKTSSLPAITHRNGTARVQIAVPECGFIYELLLAFRALTGFGVLLNTSFNGRGEPIVETPADALAGFAAMKFEYLYLQGNLLRWRSTPAADHHV
jgi:carbamoyltransferase